MQKKYSVLVEWQNISHWTFTGAAASAIPPFVWEKQIIFMFGILIIYM